MLISNSLSKYRSAKSLKFGPKWQFSVLNYFDDHLCYYGTGKSSIIARLLHFGYSSKQPITLEGAKLAP